MQETVLSLVAGFSSAAVAAGFLLLGSVRRSMHLAEVRRLVAGESGEPGLLAQSFARWQRSLRRQRRRKEIEDALAPNLTEFAELLRAGLGLLQAVETAHGSARGIWRELWAGVLQRHRTGHPLPSALAALEQEGVPALSLFVRACAVHGRHGGDLASACLLLAEDHRERLSLRREALAKSAEARFTARFLAAVPLVMGVYLAVAAPEMARPLLTEPVGRLALIYAIVSWGAGSWVVGRLLRVLRVDW